MLQYENRILEGHAKDGPLRRDLIDNATAIIQINCRQRRSHRPPNRYIWC